ncbi:hypothetical protein Poli38472_007996 [Pythium oligandrum]|uniref:Uncharacterized protein n=1 Tax=Pythium oligandrum TaxID=41045 RepID=A0A8K1FLK5_PYTOL|nr:hypothetical protein Poli38472_007996 [Pythium oligandrum]|eukprot:TMW65354.1 hypothetical protein Poli38472_007996 [Pythium oligandrum]
MHFIWFIVLLLQIVMALYSAGVASLYWWISGERRIEVQVEYLGKNMRQYFNPVIAVSIVIASAHGMMIFRTLFYSLRYRSFVFGSPKVSTSARRSNKKLEYIKRSTSSFSTRVSSFNKSVSMRFSSWNQSLWSTIQLYPIEVELVVELLLQTYQAYRMSTLVSTVWINRLLAIVIITNSWFTPIAQFVLRKHSALTRQLICVAMDSFLDIVYGIFIPLAIFTPYWHDYDLTLYSFPFILYYRDEWFINAIAENQQLFVTSWLDFTATMAPGISLFLRLYEIQNILMAYRRFSTFKPAVTNDNSVSIPAVVLKAAPSKMNRVRRSLHGLLMLWGVLIATLHAHATVVAVRGADTGCIVEMRPWGSNKYTCTVFEVSCSQKHIMGRLDEMDKQFAVVNPDTLQGLVMSNCPVLEVPPRIQEFKRLLQLKIYNSTVIEWGREAGLTATLHPELQVMFMLEVNFTEFPMGLRWDEPLPVFFDFELSGTNLTSVPDEMEKAWGLLQILSIERAPGFTQVPPFVSRLSLLYMLLLTCNSITSIPDDLLTDSNLMYCLFNNNPLERLPEHVGNLEGTTWLGFPSTKVKEIPVSWYQKETTPGSEGLPESKTVELHLFDSPYCNALQSSGPLTPTPGLNGDFMMGWFEVFCHQYFEVPYIYPVEAEHQWRAKNRV